MGAVACESGVLKLVHPGRYVEIHKEPVTAAAVMEKNPRHCVTRPDVFEYPWIVVKPESVLNLGRVFFIVPNRAIYGLLKGCGSPDQLCSRQSQSPYLEVTGTSPLKQFMQAVSGNEVSCQEQEHCKRSRKLQSEDESSDEVTVKSEGSSFDNEESYDTQIRYFTAKEYYSSDSNPSSEFSETEFEITEEVTVLKSCLRKQERVRNSRRLKVCFVLPTKEQEQQKGETETEFPGFSACGLLHH